MASQILQHEQFGQLGIEHAFATSPDAFSGVVWRPRQIHGATVVELDASNMGRALDADAVISCLPAQAIGVVTADCVPILIASATSSWVAAVHAGWRGLAAGVIENTLVRLAKHCALDGLTAVVGPHIGPCCYEVDEVVLQAFSARSLDFAFTPGRSGHWQLDLAAAAQAVLEAGGLVAPQIGNFAGICTFCDPRQLPSYRRFHSGRDHLQQSAERMLHWIRSPAR